LNHARNQDYGTGAQAILDDWGRNRGLKFGFQFHSPGLGCADQGFSNSFAHAP